MGDDLYPVTWGLFSRLTDGTDNRRDFSVQDLVRQPEVHL